MTAMKSCHECTTKKSSHYYESVKPQKIVIELNGGDIINDDYLGRCFEYLPEINIHEPAENRTVSQEKLFPIWELNRILDPSHESLEHGFARMKDGLWYIACKTNLMHCNGEMFEWWFSHCDSTERFQWLQPVRNVHGEYDPTFYAVQPEDRLVGHSIGHRFTCVRKICDEDTLFHIDYINPIEFIDTDEFAQAGITACLIGSITLRDAHLGEIAVGHICHIVKEHFGQAELVSRVWFGDIEKMDQNFPPPGFVNYLANTMLYRYWKFNKTFVKDFWSSMVQEMSCLVHFLPDFHAAELIELEARRKRNADLRAASDLYDEVSMDEESMPDDPYDEESMAEDSNLKKYGEDGTHEEKSEIERKSDDIKHNPVKQQSFEEESVSEDETQDRPSAFDRNSDTKMDAVGTYYEYDSNDDSSASNNNGMRRKSKKSSRKDKFGRMKKREKHYNKKEDFTTALSMSSTRVGKGVGV